MLVELIHSQVLKKLGDFLGGFEGLEDNFMESFDIRILANVEIGKLTFEPIKIITNYSIYEIKLEILTDGLTSRTVIPPFQNTKKEFSKAKTAVDLNIKFHPLGGFVFNKHNPWTNESENIHKKVIGEKEKIKNKNTLKELARE